jgi:hypothetical protein
MLSASTSRTCRGSSARRDSDAARGASAKLAAAIAEYFDLPEDYFGEYRQAVVQDAIAADPRLRDRVYDSLKRKPRH